MKLYTPYSNALICIILFSGCTPIHPSTVVDDSAARFALCAPSARSVAVAGSFNQWDASKDVLSGPDRNGCWATTIILPGGRYEYLFIVDDREWLTDPSVPALDDGLGGKNSVLVIEEPRY